MSDPSDYTFLSWVRLGMGQQINLTNADLLDKAKKGEALTADNITVPLSVKMVEHPSGHSQVVPTTVRMSGPGEVTGIDPRQVIRTEPAANSTNVEPNYFPLVEFDRPDFPWMFSPVSQKDDQLIPWICLVTVERREGIISPPSETVPLPVLRIQKPAEDLPDPTEAWAWAHGQITGAFSNAASAVTGPPEKNLSRLLCPRRLEPNRTYVACVVPVFELGRLAGLRKDTNNATRVFAWATCDDQKSKVVLLGEPLDLPVYYLWEFSTGLEGDFEALISRLQRREDLGDLGVGKRPMKLTKDATGIAKIDAAGNSMPITLWLEGALMASLPEIPAPSISTGDLALCEDALRTVLDPDQIPASLADIVGPPLYGRWHAGTLLAKGGLDKVRWLKDLNLDPRWRVGASLGTQVIQDQQEQLMASAWEQVGKIEKANQLLRQAQLARAAGKAAYKRHVTPMDAADLVLFSAPAHARLANESGKTAHFALHPQRGTIPAGALSAAFRRMTRSRGRLARRGGAKMGWTASLLNALNENQVRSTGPLNPHEDQVSGDLPSGMKETIPGKTGTAGFDPQKVSLKDLAEKLILPGLDPEITVTDHWWKDSRISARRVLKPGDDPLDSIMAAPEFPQPMYRALREMGQEFFLPGLDKVLPETLAALNTNDRFVEAFMVGLNHEMGRELLWRGYPTDQRGSYFCHFWDTASQIYHDEPEPDLEPIHTWQQTELGKHLHAHHNPSWVWDEKEGRIVLLMRGSLLARYPRTMIYMAKASQDPATGIRTLAGPDTTLSAEEYTEFFKNTRLFPIFQGSLSPDITFLGFDLTSKEAYGDRANNKPGWFFVFQQPPTELRFGLNASAPEAVAMRKDWGDLSWDHIPHNGENLCIQLSAGLKPGVPLDLTSEKNLPQGWAQLVNAAQFATITSQRPALIAIHASDLLSQPA